MPVVAQLDDDGRDRVAGVVVGAGDPERLAEGRAGGPRRAERVRPTAGASTARSISAQSGPPPKRTGSSTGSPVSAATRAISARASSSDAIAEVFSAIATTFDGATRPATCSWRSMNGPSGAIGNDASGRWSKSCSVWPALWTRTIAWGVAPWISASVTDE